MDGNAYIIHTINRRHDIASFFDDRDGKGAMKRFLVVTEIDRTTREADDEEIDTQSSILRIVARPLTATGLGEPSMTAQATADEVAVSGPYVVASPRARSTWPRPRSTGRSSSSERIGRPSPRAHTRSPARAHRRA